MPKSAPDWTRSTLTLQTERMNPMTREGWRFLSPNQSATNALDSLDALLNGLTNLRGAPNSNPILAAQNYMRWAEEAEAKLRNYYRDPEIPRSLHTERYWRIRSITDETARPQPLIAGEVDDQESSITKLREQLSHYRKLLEPSESERLVILDTNVLVHGLQFHEVRWNEEFEEKDVRVLMPLVVVDELDNLKNKSNRPAGQVLKDLDRYLPAGRSLDQIKIRDHVRLQLVDEPLGHSRLSNLDDEIVQQASYFSSIASAPVTVVTMVTQDRGMRVRAEAAGLDVLMLPERLKRKAETND